MQRIWTWVMAAAMAVTALAQGGAPQNGSNAFDGLAFRSIGPSLTTGRISDISVDPKNRNVWYVAASSGNLWKTENRGNTWTPIFETYGSYSLGVVVVDPRDSNVVWLGTGENNNQRSVAFGDGVYKSTDAGKTWTRVGLPNSEHIGRDLDRSARLRTSSTSRRSARSGALEETAASTRRLTAARRGKPC